MSNYRYLIIENSLRQAENVQRHVSHIRDNYSLAGVAVNEEAAVALIEKEEPDLVFAGVKPGNERIVFGALAKTSYRDFKVILICNLRNTPMSGLYSDTLDYLPKPIKQPLLEKTLLKFEKNMQLLRTFHSAAKSLSFYSDQVNGPKRICINTSKGYLIKDIGNLSFIQSINNYTEYCFGQSEKYIVPKTLLDSEMLLEPHGFFRIHQSYLVNLSKMEMFDVDHLTVSLSNGIVLPVSKRRKKVLIERIKEII